MVKKYAKKIPNHPITIISIMKAISTTAAFAKTLNKEILKSDVRNIFNVIQLISSKAPQITNARIIISSVIMTNDFVTSK